MNQISWKWLFAGGAVLGIVYFGLNPGAWHSLLKTLKGQTTSPAVETKLERAEVLGKLQHGLMLLEEVKSRLSAYESQFQGPDAQALDAMCFEEGGLFANQHQLRARYFVLRSEAPQWTQKHDAYIVALRRGVSEVSHSDDLEGLSNLADEAVEWSNGLDRDIADRNRKLASFVMTLRRLQMGR